MWYTMITFQFLLADFFSSVKLKIVCFLCNFSGSSSKPLPELKTSFKYSQMYKVFNTLLVLPENLSLIFPCPAPAWTGASPAVVSSQPRISLHHHLGIPFLPGALLNYRVSLFLVMSSFCQVTNSFWPSGKLCLEGQFLRPCILKWPLFYPHVLSLDRIWESKWEIIT